MTLPASPNSISLSQIAVEFSGNPTLNSGDYPLELGEYYGQDNAPTTGAISFSNFHGGDGVPSNGLQYHYDAQISETTTAAGGVEDISINDRTATLTNGAAYNSGNLGKIVFDGTNAYVQVTGYKGVTGKTARTSIVFAKLDATVPATTVRPLAWGSTASGAKWGMEYNTSGNLVLAAGGASRQSNATFTLNQWHMFAATIPTGVTGTAGVGQTSYTTAGTFTFTVPPGVYSISAVCVGGGGGGGGGESGRNEGVTGGGGGALCYGTIPVTPGESLTITVGSGGNGGGSGNDGTAGGTTTIVRGVTNLITAGGGGAGQERSTGTVNGGTRSVDASVTNSGGGNGGNSGGNSTDTGSGGGGAGGYSGNGGAGGTTGNGSAGSGGGGGGGGATSSGQGYGGGGVGILGAGANGTAGVLNSSGGGVGSNGGGSTSGTRPAGGLYGGGGGACDDDTNSSGGAGGRGAVRIIWGPGRSYPSTSVTDATTVTGTNTTGFLTDVTLYHNATKLIDYTTGSQEVNTASSADVTWGASLADATLGPIDGEIAKVLVYNRELTHAEITQIYNAKAVALGLAQLSATTESVQRGLFGGGYTNTYTSSIQYIDITSGANAITYGVLASSKAWAGACSSSTRGVWAGGYVAAPVNTTDFKDLASSGNTTSFGTLSQSRYGLAGFSNATVGMFCGGDTSSTQIVPTNRIDRITIANAGTVDQHGSLQQAKELVAACASTTRGIVFGGLNSSNTALSQIDRITISTTNGNAVNYGSLITARTSTGACSNATRGICFMGEDNALTDLNTIEYITIATDGNAIAWGANSNYTRALPAAVAGSTRGVVAGGMNDVAGAGSVNNISFVTIATTGTISSFGGVLVSATGGMAGCSSSHGGL